MFDAEFFVAVGFVIFVLGLGYLGVHSKIAAALDTRSDKIAGELAEAKRLRDEAMALMASFEGKRAAAEKEAADIVAQAKSEAELMAKEASQRMTDFIARRTQQAEAKIANAEAQASADVRAAAAEAAAKLAEAIMKTEVRGDMAVQLVESNISGLKAALN